MQDDDELSYAIQPLGNHLFPTHALCIKCHEIKPIKSFKTKSTNAQAFAWGYKKAIEYTSEVCNICRRPKKKPHEMTLKEIHHKIVTGEIKGGAIGKMITEDRIAEGKRKKREGVINRWKAIREKAWAELYSQAEKEWDSTRKMIKNHEDKPELRSFLTAYLAVIKQVKAFITAKRKQGIDNPTKGVPWSYYINKGDKDRLLALWGETPQEVKLGKYQPTDILTNRLNTDEGETQ